MTAGSNVAGKVRPRERSIVESGPKVGRNGHRPERLLCFVSKCGVIATNVSSVHEEDELFMNEGGRSDGRNCGENGQSTAESFQLVVIQYTARWNMSLSNGTI